MKKKALILHSGGADSTLLIIVATRMGREVATVTLNYGQSHCGELGYSEQTTEKAIRAALPPPPIDGWDVNMPRRFYLDVTLPFEHIRSNLLHAGTAVYLGVHEMHVPGRNSIFLALAMGIAESHGYDEVWIGCDYSDRVNRFPDCTQEYVVAMNEVARQAGSRPIEIKAPLLGLSKQDVLQLLQSYGIDRKDVYSGYSAPVGAAPPPPSTLPPPVVPGVPRALAEGRGL